MKRILQSLSFLALAAWLAQPSGVAAQPYSSIPDETEYLDFVRGSGVNGGYGVQVGPYVGRFLGDPSDAQFSIFCVDFLHYAKDQPVTVRRLTDDLSNTRVWTALSGESDLATRQQKTFETYWQAAYLSSLFETTSTGAWGSLHAAIWSLTSGVEKGNAGERQVYLDLAELALNDASNLSFDPGSWYVLTPTQGYDGQEFLIRTVSVPEPAAFILLASGLLLLAAFSRSRLRTPSVEA